MLKIKRRSNESSRSLVSRFSRAVRRSGILIEAKKKKYYRKPKSETAKKEQALRRKELKEKYQKLKKMGKI